MRESIIELLKYLNHANNGENANVKNDIDSPIAKVKMDIDHKEYKEMVKEGRNERKSCHSLIVEVEKLMYKMNSLLVSEQMKCE